MTDGRVRRDPSVVDPEGVAGHSVAPEEEGETDGAVLEHALRVQLVVHLCFRALQQIPYLGPSFEPRAKFLWRERLGFKICRASRNDHMKNTLLVHAFREKFVCSQRTDKIVWIRHVDEHNWY